MADVATCNHRILRNEYSAEQSCQVNIHEINEKYHISMPIVDSIYEILYNRSSPTMEIRKLSEHLK